MVKRQILRIVAFFMAAFMLLDVFDGDERYASGSWYYVPQYGKVKMTEREKRVLRSAFERDWDLYDEGSLNEEEKYTLCQMRAAVDYLKKKYPSYDLKLTGGTYQHRIQDHAQFYFAGPKSGETPNEENLIWRYAGSINVYGTDADPAARFEDDFYRSILKRWQYEKLEGFLSGAVDGLVYLSIHILGDMSDGYDENIRYSELADSEKEFFSSNVFIYIYPDADNHASINDSIFKYIEESELISGDYTIRYLNSREDFFKMKDSTGYVEGFAEEVKYHKEQ